MLRKLTRATVVAGALSLGVVALEQPGLAATTPTGSSNAQVRAGLNRSLPATDFRNIALKDAIDFLRDVSGANLHVNWRALEAAGVTPDTTINIKLRAVSLRKVLSLVLAEAAGGNATLTFYVDDGVIEVTTQELADSIMFTVVYPVQDLLFEPAPIDIPPDFALANESNAGTGQRGYGGGGGGRGGRSGQVRGGVGGGGGGGSIFGTGGGGGSSGQAQDKGAKAEELVNLIVETVSPNVWTQNGGKASIRFFNGNLIVTAPRSVHEQIGGPID